MPTRGEEIGRIVRLQVQKVPIKEKGVGYRPEWVLPVDRASVDAWGMLGWDGDRWVVDAHNKAHPSQRGGGRRQLSIGFTGHYDAMAERFGDAPVGIAGENVIVAGPALSLSELGEGVMVVTSDGTELLLERPRVAAPCVEFTSFMLGLDEVASLAEVEGPLADLHDGRRGFIVAADHASAPVEVAVGDRVFLIDADG
jgi:MOSC domain-containing protein YiiM